MFLNNKSMLRKLFANVLFDFKGVKMSKITGLIVSTLFLVACAVPPATDGVDRTIAPVRLTQISQGVQITTDDSVLFDVGNANISEKGNQFIDKVAEMLLTKTKANVVVEGHTDNTGNAQVNIILSERRSLNVRDALINRKVQAFRITSRGYGQTKPIAENTTIEGRQMNRRSEIIVLGETIENVGGNDLLNTLTNAMTNFLNISLETLNIDVLRMLASKPYVKKIAIPRQIQKVFFRRKCWGRWTPCTAKLGCPLDT